MTTTRSVVLLGLRGSGKSTVGAALAPRLGVPFVDLDDRTPALLSETGCADALAKHGEPAFRAAEHDALERVLSEPGPIVLALGGGTPTAPGAAGLLRGADALLVYLRARPETLRDRLARTDLDGRPSLTGAGTLEEISALFEARDPLYADLATVIETDNATEEQLLSTLTELARA